MLKTRHHPTFKNLYFSPFQSSKKYHSTFWNWICIKKNAKQIFSWGQIVWLFIVAAPCEKVKTFDWSSVILKSTTGQVQVWQVCIIQWFKKSNLKVFCICNDDSIAMCAIPCCPWALQQNGGEWGSAGIFNIKKFQAVQSGVDLFKGDFYNQIKGQITYLS